MTRYLIYFRHGQPIRESFHIRAIGLLLTYRSIFIAIARRARPR